MIGVLYESREWSDFHLVDELRVFGCQVEMIDMEDDGCEEKALRCDMLASRVFASAYSRGHEVSLRRAPSLLAAAERVGIRVINPARAHAFETSKGIKYIIVYIDMRNSASWLISILMPSVFLTPS